MLYGSSLNHSPKRINLNELVRFPVAELQFEFWKTERNAAGDVFAHDAHGKTTPPAQCLHERGVDVWGYVDLSFGDKRYIGWTPPRESDPYWWKRHVVRTVDGANWWHYCQDGTLSNHYYGGLSPIDVTNQAYRAWVVDTILAEMVDLPVAQLRFDNAFFMDVERYVYCPMRCTWQEWAEGLFDIWDRLRANGVRVVANGAWQMTNPHDDPSAWEFPALKHLDGVMIEHNSGISLSDGWWSLTIGDRLEQVARRWLGAGKAVVVVATLHGGDPTWGDDFDGFARHWYSEAHRVGFNVAINHRRFNYGNTPWLGWYKDEPKPAPLISEEQLPHESFEEMAWQLAEDAHCVDVNPQAALLKAMLADGYIPTSNEFMFDWEGVAYVGQRAERGRGPLAPRVYFVQVGRWDQVDWMESTP